MGHEGQGKETPYLLSIKELKHGKTINRNGEAKELVERESGGNRLNTSQRI